MDTEVRPTYIDVSIANDILELGGEGIKKCYQCGTCTATCPLSEEYTIASRRLIKYVQLGLKEKVLCDVTPWVCYYCGDCSKTCPKEAAPGEIIMAVRRYITKNYAVGRIAELFYNKSTAAISWIVLTIIGFLGLYAFSGTMNMENINLSSFISFNFIHSAGLALGVIVLLSIVMNLYIEFRSILNGINVESEKSGGGSWIKSFFSVLVKEVGFQKKYLKCGNKTRYIAHMSLFWGFTGLFIATLIVFGIDFYGLTLSKNIPFIIGVVFGVVMLYGTIYFLVERIRKKEEFAKYTCHVDWIFLILLFLAGLTGFILDVSLFLNIPLLAYSSFMTHLVVVFDLLLTAPFTKFSHAIYRPLALWITSALNQFQIKEVMR